MRRTARIEGTRTALTQGMMLNQELVLSFQRAMMLKIELDRAVAASMLKQTARRGEQDDQIVVPDSVTQASNTTDVTDNPFSIQNYKTIASPTPNADL